jgi:hypothetical protein
VTRTRLGGVDAGGGLVAPDHLDVPLLGAPPAAADTGRTRLYMDANGILQLVPAAAGPNRRIAHHWGSGTAFPAAGAGPGDSYLHTAWGLHFYNGTGWRQRGPHELTAAQRAALTTVGLYDGYEVYETDTQARARWDAASGSWLLFDSKWQSYTPGMLVGASVPTIGAGALLGHYFRQGRLISLDGYLYIGTGTSFNGGSGIIYMDYPPGYRPSLSLFGANPNSQSSFGGPARMNGTSFSGGWCLNKWDATPANRRMWFVNFTDLVTQGGAGGGVNITAVGHFMVWQNTYETAFEA